MVPRQIVILVVAALGARGVFAQSAALDSVDRFVQAERTRQRIPGMSIAILRGDSIVLARGYGLASAELNVPATERTVYQSGSVAKQFTSAAIMLLVQDGRLRLGDTITRYLPEGPAWWHGITIRQLLTHTSGIRDYADSTLDLRRDYTEDQLVKLAGSLPADFAPGTHWSYSNTGYVLLGIIIHRITGQFYGDVLRERVFGPLGMSTTRVISEAEIIPNRAAGYELVNDTLRNQSWVSPSLNTPADGSLYFTVLDLAHWAVGLNHARVPDQASLDASWTPVRLSDGGTFPYGFGWSLVTQRGHPRIGHGGSWQGFRASIQRYPEYGLTVIVLANLAQAQPEAISYGIAGILEPALAAPHLLPAGALAGAPGPPQPVPDALRRIAAGDSTTLTPGFRRSLLPSFQEALGRAVGRATTWTSPGCDDVASRAIWRYGSSVARICYANSVTGTAGHLYGVLYTSSGQVAGLDGYGF
ncbi:MAG TPA: serine hydrolase domain-containing protein [Gemmatimonadales bacterium]|nr:serine hydrolase domain-containing protein [Gemmatimonadales bacterium]